MAELKVTVEQYENGVISATSEHTVFAMNNNFVFLASGDSYFGPLCIASGECGGWMYCTHETDVRLSAESLDLCKKVMTEGGVPWPKH